MALVAGMKNVGRLDCVVRVLLGTWLTVQAVAMADRPFLAIAWATVGVFVLVTGVLRICPVYTLIRALRPRAVEPPAPRRP